MKTFSIFACLLLSTGAIAIEPRLKLGQQEFGGGVAFISQYVDNGAVRINDISAEVEARARIANIGFAAHAWLAIGDDEGRGIEAAEMAEFNLTLDYIWEMEDTFQLIPFFNLEGFPAFSGADEAGWIGVDFWYLLPFEGLEIGARAETDVFSDYGTHLSLSARQMVQYSPMDFLIWQTLHYGDEDYHRFTSGAASSGLTTFELGAEITTPLPWEASWLQASLVGYWWLDSEDQDAVGVDTAEFVISMGIDISVR